MNIYCGNNQLDPTLINGTHQLGTRYRCFKKGVGVGLNLPYDRKYQGEYQAIDNTRIYCGDKENLPNGYNRFGNISQCLQKGVAIGKRQKALRGEPHINFYKTKKFKYLLFTIISIIIFLILYYTKPDFICEIDENNNKNIIWKNFILYYLIFCIIIFLIIYKIL